MKERNTDVASNIRAELARQRKSQAALARDISATDQWVHRRLTGQVSPTVDDLERFAAALGVSVVDLLPAEATA